MKQSTQPRPLKLSTLCGLLLLAAGCGGGSSSADDPSPSDPGEALVDPETGRYFLVDENSGGISQTPRILRSAWGRLVRVFALETDDVSGPRREMQRNFVISPGLNSGQGLLLETNQVTGEQSLLILENINSPQGLDSFFNRLRQAEQNLSPIFDVTSGLFTMVPRNAAIVVQFDDIIDPDTIDPTTVKLQVGVPATVPFESRILIDPNHGDLADYTGGTEREFYTTRVILDPTISELEAFETTPPLPVNGLGLPPSLDVGVSNIQLRIPTETAQGFQEEILQNPSGHGLTTSSNGSIDFGSPTLDVVRSMRSGGPGDATADPNNGFLPDQVDPRLTGTQPAAIQGNPVYEGNNEFVVPAITFASIFCSQTPVIGDVIAQQQIGVFAAVTAPPLPVNNGTVMNVSVRLLVWPEAWGAEPEEWVQAAPGSLQFLSAYDPAAGDPAACFVQISPTPGDDEMPTAGIFTSSIFRLRFSEPIDPRSLTAFDAIQLLRNSVAASTSDYVSGTIATTQDQQEITFIPDLPLAHQTGQAEPYYLELSDSAVLGLTDLAGNEIEDLIEETRFDPGTGGDVAFPNVQMTVFATAAPQLNGGRTSRFTSEDEDPPVAEPGDPPLAEWGGQHTYDLQNEALRPRPVTRMQAVADRSNFMLAPMMANPTGVQSPVSNFGSKTHKLWRFADVGLAAFDLVDYNVDVEGLSWAPFGGEVAVDNYDSFEMRVSHGFFLPDEAGFPASGLDQAFDANILSPSEDPQRIVHDRSLGYGIHPGDIFVVGQNVRMIPYPMNRTISPDLFRYYTWRDTSILTRAGPGGFGGPMAAWYIKQGLATPVTGDCILLPLPNPFNAPGQVQSAFLPLLMEFRCFPDNSANGVNRFDTSLAAGGGQPFFTAFSEGGIDTSQNIVTVNPDLEESANGGYNPNSAPIPGAPTPGRNDA
ncbi:MAG: Ig-like domain-containing protein, partial [bacterium]|nr:Ig-like domain-containing protein [bacterium]